MSVQVSREDYELASAFQGVPASELFPLDIRIVKHFANMARREGIAPRALSPLEEATLSRGLVEGTRQVGTFNLDQISTDQVSKAFRKKHGLQEGDTTSLEQLLDLGLKSEDLFPGFRDELKRFGILSGTEFNRQALDTMSQGLFPEARGIREQLTQRAVDLVGSLDPGSMAQDPFFRAALADNQQGIRSAFTSRGLNNTGAAAVLETTQGLQLLENVRQARNQEALGILAAAQQMATGGDLGRFLTERGDLQFQRGLGTAILEAELLSVRRAEDLLRREADKASSSSRIFANQFASSSGQLLGGGWLSGSTYQGGNTQTGQGASGTGLGSIAAFL